MAILSSTESLLYANSHLSKVACWRFPKNRKYSVSVSNKLWCLPLSSWKPFSTNTISHSWEDGSIQRRTESQRKTMTKNNKRNESVSKSIEYVGKIWHCIDNLGWAAYWLIADSGLVSCAGEGWKQIPCSQKTICFPNKILHPITWMNRYRWYVEEKLISNRSIWGYQVCVPVWDDIWECIIYWEEIAPGILVYQSQSVAFTPSPTMLHMSPGYYGHLISQNAIRFIKP